MSRFNPVVLLAAVCCLCASARGGEERIRGVLEKTAKDGACAQITDALNEIYYVLKSAESEKLCQGLMGKSVALTGVVEQKTGDPAYYLNLKTAEAYQPKLPPAPAPKPPEPSKEPSTPLPPPGKTEVPPSGEVKKTGEAPKEEKK